MTELPYRQGRLRVCALSENGRIADWIVENAGRAALLGNIYVGRVERVVEGLRAAFVRIAGGQMCFLPLGEAREPIYKTPGRSGTPRGGDELLVQVSREAQKEKLPAVTARLSIHGPHMIAVTDGPGIGVSSKLSGERREELRAFLERCRDKCRKEYAAEARESSGARGSRADDALQEAAGGRETGRSRCRESAGEAFCPGFVVRTSAGERPEAELEAEYRRLFLEMARLVEHGRSRTCYSLLREARPLWQEMLGRVPGERVEELVTDSARLYEEIAGAQAAGEAGNQVKLRLYEDRLLPLYKLYSLESVLAESLAEKVWMRSGGFLVIQQTEAFAAVDVNSGRCEGKKEAEEYCRRINLEAAGEIARQLRLRQLSGIILIDFINLREEEHRSELLRALSEHLKGDPAQAVVVDMTKLQIVEVTRRKLRRPLQEEVRFSPCAKETPQV